ncbi:uncharacterized protein LOC127833798 [Dreissena polymorpha]|uniref:Uncharacterized protein n=1 Tax=Dreissena polymorpha TaxID=45954 RepID=A0A9D4GB42_DREPO|nr:uncharacterized protein LOC127833798 [Dreissena polymorpha]KAH3813865.1 hypothetical protein DPMN_142336 [Dreissena polymorpha]
MMEKSANGNPPSDYPVSQQKFQTQQQQPTAFTQQQQPPAFTQQQQPPAFTQQQQPPAFTQQQLPTAFTQQAVNYGQPDRKEQAGYIQPGYVGEPGHVVVLSQPQPAAVIVPIETVPTCTDYMVLSIACLCCFFPTAIAAIHFSIESRKMVANGNMVKANRYSEHARNLIIHSMAIGAVWIVLVIVLRRK